MIVDVIPQIINITVGNIQGPQGPPGDQGPQGDDGPAGIAGPTGAAGPANTLSIGTVTTGAAGSSAAATVTGSAPAQTLNLTIPQGQAADDSVLNDIRDQITANHIPPVVVQPTQIITDMQSGHGFTTGGSGVGTATTNDTTDFVRGKQAFKVVSAANGIQGQIRKTGISAIDLTDSALRFTFKIDDVTHLNRLEVLIGTSNFSNVYKFKLHTHSTTSPNIVQSGEWVTLTVGWADLISSSGSFVLSNGLPGTTSGFTDVRVDFYDDAAGAVTIHLQAIEVVPESQPQFPRGVVSITFDDSWQSVYDYAKPAMETYGYQGSLYNIIDTIGTASHLTLAELQRLQKAGWEVGSHAYASSVHTSSYTGVTAAAARADMRAQRGWLADNGFDSDGFAYPKGEFGQTTDGTPVDQIAAEFFGYARTIVSETKENLNPSMPHRIRAVTGIRDTSAAVGGTPVSALTGVGGYLDQTQAHGSWLVLTFHKILSGSGVPADSTECSETAFVALMADIAARGMSVLPVNEVLRQGRVARGLRTRAVPPPNVMGPPDHGMTAWTYDPSFASSTTLLTAGTLYRIALDLRDPTVVTGIHSLFSTAGSGLTAGQNFVGLYNSSGTLIAEANADTFFTSTNTGARVTFSPVFCKPGKYYVAYLANGTTPPTLLRTNGAFTGTNNVNLSASTYRYATNGTALTALPATITLSGGAVGPSLWAAI